ncbi:uncharacterized protein LOC144620158 [Crassostrea virginica]
MDIARPFLSLEILEILVIVSLSIVPGGRADFCGSLNNDKDLYCPENYKCCDSTIHSCCEDGYICTTGHCISIVAVISVPCVIIFLIAVSYIFKTFRKRRTTHNVNIPELPMKITEQSWNFVHCRFINYIKHFVRILKNKVIS